MKQEISREETRKEWEWFWSRPNRFNNLDEEGNPIGKGVVPKDPLERDLYYKCNRLMHEQFRNIRKEIIEQKQREELEKLKYENNTTNNA